jgi:hypothetical protein
MHLFFDLEVDAFVADNRVAQVPENRRGRFDMRVHIRVRSEGEVGDLAQMFELTQSLKETAIG